MESKQLRDMKLRSILAVLFTVITQDSTTAFHFQLPFPSSSPLHRPATQKHVEPVRLTAHAQSAALLAKQRSSEDGPNRQTPHDENDTTGAKILDLAVPALAGLAIDPLMTLADTVFVGRYAQNSAALAGLGSAAALLTFSFYIFNFLCTATTPLVASRRAGKDEDGALAVGGQALSLALAVGSALSFALILFSSQLLSVMGTTFTGAEATKYATDFLTLRAIAAPAVLVCSAATGILRGYLDTKTPIVILFAANLVNFILDVILIAGLGMGPTGAAIATTTAEWIAAASFLGVLAGQLPSAEGELGSNQQVKDTDCENAGESTPLKSSPIMRVLPSLTIPPLDEVKPLLVASSSVFLRTVVLQLALSGAAAMAARSGPLGLDGASASVAAHQVALQLWLLCSFVCDALAAASQALIADAIGRKDPFAVRALSKTVFAYSAVLGVILSGLLALGDLSGFLLNVFSSDVATQAALAPLLMIVIITQPLNALVFTADGVLQGASEFTYQAKSMALSVGVAVASFVGVESISPGDGGETLIHVWQALIVLQLMRLITSVVKVCDPAGPIDLRGGNAR